MRYAEASHCRRSRGADGADISGGVFKNHDSPAGAGVFQALPGSASGRRHGGGARAHQSAVVRPVRRPRARHQRRRADGRLPRRSVQEARLEAGQHRRHLHPEGAARRHHAEAGAAGVHEGRAKQRRSNGTTMSSRGRSTWRRHAQSIDNSELVFVGYGVVAPEYNWDDYKGVDVKGKTLVMLVNDPPVPDPPTRTSSIRRCSAARR